MVQQADNSQIGSKLNKSTFELSISQIIIKDKEEFAYDNQLQVENHTEVQDKPIGNGDSYKSNIVTGNHKTPLYSVAPPTRYISHQAYLPKMTEINDSLEPKLDTIEKIVPKAFETESESEVSNEVLFYDKNSNASSSINRDQIRQNLHEAYDMIRLHSEEEESVNVISQNFLNEETEEDFVDKTKEPDEIAIPKRSEFAKVARGLDFKAIMSGAEIPGFLNSKNRL